MWELDHKKSWGPNNWCFQTIVLEKALKSPLDCKEIKPVNPKGNQPWIFIGRTDVEAEAPDGHLKLLWLPDAKSWLIGWMASLTQWTRDWAYSMRWWRTGKPGVLQSMGWQRVGHNWATEQALQTKKRKKEEKVGQTRQRDITRETRKARRKRAWKQRENFHCTNSQGWVSCHLWMNGLPLIFLFISVPLTTLQSPWWQGPHLFCLPLNLQW